MRRIRRYIKLAGYACLAWALAIELRKDPADREWNGELAGVVPYDLRIPTIEKLRTTYWDTRNETIVRRKAFGVGWTVNFAAIAKVLGVID